MKSVLVLKAAATNSRAYVDATLGVRRAIRELNKLGSSFEGPAEDAPSEWTRVLSWSDAAHGARARFFSDLENDVMYLQSEAAMAEGLATLTKVLRSHVPTASLDELKQAAARENDATGRGLVRLALGASTEVDGDVATCLKNGLLDRDALVRRNAGFAMAVTTWPELVPELARAVAVEEEPEIRALLNRYLEVLESVKRR
jgi:hypothetical protein